MRESYWGYWLIVLGVFVITVMLLISNVTNTSTQDYYLVKEVSEAAMVDAVDYGYYRQSGELRINREKFIENFLRRFSENVSLSTYTIDFYDIYESPPKTSVKVTTKSNTYNVKTDQTSFDIVNRVDAILELDGTVSGSESAGTNTNSNNNSGTSSNNQNNNNSGSTNNNTSNNNTNNNSSSNTNTNTNDKNTNNDKESSNNKDKDNDKESSNNKDNDKDKETSKPTTTKKSKIKLNKDLVVLTVKFYNRATITADVTTYGNVSDKVSWESSNSDVVAVSSSGDVLAKSPGTAYITATTKDGVSAKTKVKVIDRMRKNPNNTWNISDKDFTDEEKESYLDNAEELCHSKWFKEDPERYYYCKKQEYVYYTGSPDKLVKHTMTKKVGVSATDYAIFISSAKQSISLLKMNSNGKWKVLRTARTSTRPAYNDGHYRHDFYMGASYVLDNFFGKIIIQFSDVDYYKGDNRLPNSTTVEPHYAHRAIHRTPEAESMLGIPRSAGCARVPNEFIQYLVETLKNQYGTRIIYF